MNYKNNCRTCLGIKKDMRDINSSIIIGGDEVRISDILQNFYNYKVTSDPLLPDNICINCVHQLTFTYSFKVLIESSIKTLNESQCLGFGSDNYDYYNDESDELNLNTVKHKIRKRINRTQITSNDEYKPIFCVECKAEFSTVKSLMEHCTNNHPVKSLIGRDCEYCNEKFDDFRSLILHTKLHIRPYLCENCWVGFFNEEQVNTHFCQPNTQTKGNMSSDKMLRQCDQCGKSYPPGYIRIHMLTHGTDRPYSCKYCPKKFKVPGGLHSHVLWNHKRTRNHKCEVCNATFISSSSRSSHIRKNHLKEKKYSCDSCGKRFFSKSELQRHSLTHTGVKNFHCHLCDKSYQTRYGLNVHLRSHAQISMNVLNL